LTESVHVDNEIVQQKQQKTQQTNDVQIMSLLVLVMGRQKIPLSKNQQKRYIKFQSKAPTLT
jgi:hypothetical protein